MMIGLTRLVVRSVLMYVIGDGGRDGVKCGDGKCDKVGMR